MARLFSYVSVFLFGVSLTIAPVAAQGLPSILGGKKTPATTPAAPTDTFGRTTPRQSIYRFLEACHSGNYTRAVHYLDLSRMNSAERSTKGPELAQQLANLLDHDAQFDLTDLNDTPDGDREDSQKADTDILSVYQYQNRPITLTLERRDFNQLQIWLVSADSLQYIPELNADLGDSYIENVLPRPLVAISFLGTPLWVWIALLIIALTISFLSRQLSRLFLWLASPVTKRYTATAHHRLQEFTEPLRLILATVVFKACVEAIVPSALLRLYITRLVELLFFLGVASFIMRIVDVISDHFRSRLDARQSALSYSVIPLLVRFAKICIVGIAVLATLASWGYNTNAILAGLGVGGLAVALAAQKTIENLFGSLSVIFDRPVLVGDFCNFGGNVGTIEDIGLRSTRIRTLDRTVVTIPNSTFSTMSLENYGKRDRMWFHPALNLRKDTSPVQLDAAMKAITGVLQDHPNVDPTAVPVRFTKIAMDSFVIEIFSYVQTPDFDEFLRIQSQLLSQITSAIWSLGISFAMPLQESIVTPVDPSVRPFRIVPPASLPSSTMEASDLLNKT